MKPLNHQVPGGIGNLNTFIRKMNDKSQYQNLQQAPGVLIDQTRFGTFVTPIVEAAPALSASVAQGPCRWM